MTCSCSAVPIAMDAPADFVDGGHESAAARRAEGRREILSADERDDYHAPSGRQGVVARGWRDPSGLSPTKRARRACHDSDLVLTDLPTHVLVPGQACW